MATCTDCSEPARSNGLCSKHYQARSRAGTLPEPTKRRDVHQVALRVSAATWAKIEAEAKRSGESAYAVAIRWLDERAARRR